MNDKNFLESPSDVNNSVNFNDEKNEFQLQPFEIISVPVERKPLPPQQLVISAQPTMLETAGGPSEEGLRSKQSTMLATA